MKNIFAFATLFLVGSMSFADQCALIPREQANAAAQIIHTQIKSKGSASLVLLCDSCSGKDAKAEKIKAVSVKVDKSGYSPDLFEVSVLDSKGMDHELDLAYTFITVGVSKASVRMAPLAGCSYSQGSEGDVLK